MGDAHVTITREGQEPVRYRQRTADVFEFRARGEYAVFIVDDQRVGGDGYFVLAIESSFGGYAFAWGSPGPNFRSFLCDLNLSYVLGKMVPNDQVFDGEATTRNVRHEILQARRAGDCTASDARDSWPEDEFESEGAFATWLSTAPLADAVSAWECARSCRGSRSREFEALYELFWPMLRAALRDEETDA